MSSGRPGIKRMASAAAALTGGELVGDDREIVGPATLAGLSPGRLAFIKDTQPERLKQAEACAEAVILVLPALRGAYAGAHIVVDDPRRAFGRVVEAWFAPKPIPGIAPTAFVHPEAVLGNGVSIGHNSVVAEGVVIGANTEIRNNVVIGRNVRLGKECLIKSNTVIGEEGFGVAFSDTEDNKPIPHIGSVVIGDNVMIGALNTVASGTIDPTIVEDFVQTDDHVHIAHNCRIGRNTILTACVELSGSVILGERVWIGPQSCVMNGITIGERAYIGLGAVVTKNCDPDAIYAGSPARKLRDR